MESPLTASRKVCRRLTSAPALRFRDGGDCAWLRGEQRIVEKGSVFSTGSVVVTGDRLERNAGAKVTVPVVCTFDEEVDSTASLAQASKCAACDWSTTFWGDLQEGWREEWLMVVLASSVTICGFRVLRRVLRLLKGLGIGLEVPQCLGLNGNDEEVSQGQFNMSGPKLLANNLPGTNNGLCIYNSNWF